MSPVLGKSVMAAKTRRRLVALVATSLAVMGNVSATESQISAEASNIVVLSKIALPWYAPRFYVVRKFREAVPQYEAIPGLAYKYFTLSSDSKFGGLYLWKDLAAAHSWFNETWFAKVLAERGSPAQLRYFDAPVILDNVKSDTPSGTDGLALATIVTLPIPEDLAREELIAGFRKSIPFYQNVPGLLRKYFILTQDHQFGGIYLWADRASADRFFDKNWHAKIQATYAVDATIEYFEAPVITPSRLPENKIAQMQQ